jgi:aminopeptidase N
MEHQSAVAYGNKFRQGYAGRSGSKYGIKFDFIIIHESAHEWWGNSVTSKDIADMWIHESFGAYAEALFVECVYGRDAMMDYINAKKYDVRNDRPIIGPYDVNQEGSGDMYPKGALMLHTLRSVLDNDSLWFALLRGLATTFRHRTVTTGDVVGFVNKAAGEDYTYLFDQYLRHSTIPRLDVTLLCKGDSLSARYRWRADSPDFRMPVKVTTSPGSFAFLRPTSSWHTVDLGVMDPGDFRVAEDLFYVEPRIRVMYQESE